MKDNGTHRESLKCARSLDTVRLLWEATRRVIAEGIDTEDLVALCGLVVRLAEHRLLDGASCPPSAESEQAAEQLRSYRNMASDLLQWANTPAHEPDWAGLAERLKSAGAAPLEIQDQPR
jgi:hypothetical protein